MIHVVCDMFCRIIWYLKEYISWIYTCSQVYVKCNGLFIMQKYLTRSSTSFFLSSYRRTIRRERLKLLWNIFIYQSKVREDKILQIIQDSVYDGFEREGGVCWYTCFIHFSKIKILFIFRILFALERRGGGGSMKGCYLRYPFCICRYIYSHFPKKVRFMKYDCRLYSNFNFLVIENWPNIRAVGRFGFIKKFP